MDARARYWLAYSLLEAEDDDEQEEPVGELEADSVAGPAALAALLARMRCYLVRLSASARACFIAAFCQAGGGSESSSDSTSKDLCASCRVKIRLFSPRAGGGRAQRCSW